MLGIRHYQGVSVDLWQGPPRDFFCDFAVEIRGAGQSRTQAECLPVSRLTSVVSGSEPFAPLFEEWVQASAVEGHRHMSLIWAQDYEGEATDAQAYSVMSDLRNCLNGKSQEAYPSRVTFICKTEAVHTAFQAALFSVFPEHI